MPAAKPPEFRRRAVELARRPGVASPTLAGPNTYRVGLLGFEVAEAYGAEGAGGLADEEPGSSAVH
jgi:hypothetical protein